MLSEKDILYFLHIPKTAGTSLTAFLYDYYDANEYYDKSIMEDLIKTPKLELENYKLFCGHFGWYLPGLISGRPKIITMLRDPIRRTISQYKHIKRSPGLFGLDEGIKDIGLTDFLNNIESSVAPLIINAQTATLVFDDLVNDFIGLQFKSTNEIIEVLTDTLLLDKAVKRLESLEFVGIVEAFDKSIEYLCYTLGWPLPLYSLDKSNEAPSKGVVEKISEDDFRRIKEFNNLDRQLYLRAIEIFNDKYLKLTKADMENNYCKRMLSGEKANSIYYGFEKAIYGSGWYGREFQTDGAVYRWTGPGTLSVLNFSLDASTDYTISFYAAAYEHDMLKAVSININGEYVELNMLYPSYFTNKNECVFSGTIDRELLKINIFYTRLELFVEKTICPKEIDSNSDDSRNLGIYVKWLEIYPRQVVGH